MIIPGERHSDATPCLCIQGGERRPGLCLRIVASDFGAGQDCLAPGYISCYSYNYWNSYNYPNSLVTSKQLEQNHVVLAYVCHRHQY